jgi:hypothetical protein
MDMVGGSLIDRPDHAQPPLACQRARLPALGDQVR